MKRLNIQAFTRFIPNRTLTVLLLALYYVAYKSFPTVLE